MFDKDQWFAVRCCCTPKKVFGFIRLKANDFGQVMSPVNLLDREGARHRAEIRNLCRYADAPSKGPGVVDITHNETAIYSDDRPIEFWRNIVGFIEASGEDVV